MKKHARIITLLVCLALIVGSVFAVGAFAGSAEPEEKTARIVRANVKYGAKMYMLFTVEAVSGTLPDGVGIATYETSVSKTPLHVSREKENFEDISFYTTLGLAAQDITTPHYYSVVDKDGNEISDRLEYSAEEYANARLAVSGISDAQTKLYRAIIEYGNAADAVFGSKWESAKVIYSPRTTVKLLRGEGADSTTVNIIANILNSYLTNDIVYITSSDAPAYHEIILGDSNRDITAKAYEKLALIRDESLGQKGYAVYSDGYSVAVVWDEDDDELVKSAAIDYFVSYCLASETLALPEGTVKTELVDTVGYWAQKDQALKAAAWVSLENHLTDTYGDAALSSETVTALKELYSFYTDTGDMVGWFAGLVETANTGVEGGMAYYYSNSARDTYDVAFPSGSTTRYLLLPDLESTSQALGFIQTSGLADRFNGYRRPAIPEWFGEGLKTYAKNLQSTDGYFYHPQWPKADITYSSSRLSRDLSHGSTILGIFGEGLPYPYPGTSVAAVALTSPLTGSASSAVSKVTSLAYSGSDSYAVSVARDPILRQNRFNSVEDFRAYLEDLDITNISYSAGNELTALTGEIKAHDDKNGWSYQKGEGYMYELITFLNRNRNTEDGTWQATGVKDQFYRVNGLFKISGIYNAAEVEMPLADKAIATAIKNLDPTLKIGAGVDVYNVWFTISNVMNNVTSYASDKSLVESTRSDLIKKAPELIRATKTLIAPLQISDGSFAYGVCTTHNIGLSADTSQGMPVTPGHQHEGDVNGTVIASTGIISNIHNALGVYDYKVPLFGEADRQRYVSIIEKRYADQHGGKLPDGSDHVGNIVSDTIPAFEDGTGAYYNSDFTSFASTKLDFNGADINDIAALQGTCLTTPADGSTYAYVNAEGRLEVSSVSWSHMLVKNTSAIKSDIYAVETDISFASAEKTADRVIGWLSLTSASNGTGDSAFVRISIVSSADSIILELTDTGNETRTLATLSVGEWYNLRFVAEHIDEVTVSLSAYVNGKCTASNIAVTNKGKTHELLSGFGIEMRGNANGGTFKAYFDNMYMGGEKPYTPYEYPEYTMGSGVYYNSENPGFSDYRNSFDGSIDVSAIAKASQNISLSSDGSLISATNSEWGVWRLNNGSEVKVGYKYVFESDLSFSDITANNKANIGWLAFTAETGNAAAQNGFYRIYVNAVTDESGNVTEVTLANTAIENSNYIEYARLGVGEWYNLRIECTELENSSVVADIYLNGVRVATKSGGGNVEGTSRASFDGFVIEHRSVGRYTIKLDNLYLGTEK